MSTGSLQTKLSRFLFTYHNTPQSTTGQTPAELLMNRRPHTHLQCLLPNTAETVASKQKKKRNDKTQRPKRGTSVKMMTFEVENYRPGPKWLPVTVVEPTGRVSYRCKLQDGEIVRRHVDQVRSRHVPYKQIERDPVPDVLDTQKNQDEQPESNSPVENDNNTHTQKSDERLYPKRNKRQTEFFQGSFHYLGQNNALTKERVFW